MIHVRFIDIYIYVYIYMYIHIYALRDTWGPKKLRKKSEGGYGYTSIKVPVHFKKVLRRALVLKKSVMFVQKTSCCVLHKSVFPKNIYILQKT
jgi:hypothetical protein